MSTNPVPPMPDDLGEAGRAEWADAVAYAAARGDGRFPWSAMRGSVENAARAADLAAYTLAAWEAEGSPVTVQHGNGPQGAAPSWKALVKARETYATLHITWAGRPGPITTNAHGGQKGQMRSPDRVHLNRTREVEEPKGAPDAALAEVRAIRKAAG